MMCQLVLCCEICSWNIRLSGTLLPLWRHGAAIWQHDAMNEAGDFGDPVGFGQYTEDSAFDQCLRTSCYDDVSAGVML